MAGSQKHDMHPFRMNKTVKPKIHFYLPLFTLANNCGKAICMAGKDFFADASINFPILPKV